MINPEIERRFATHPVDESKQEKIAALRSVILTAAEIVEEAVPQGREQSLAFTKLEEALFFAVAGVARSE